MRLDDIYALLDSQPRLWNEREYTPIDFARIPEGHRQRVRLRLSAWKAFLREKSAAKAADTLGVARSFVSKTLKLIYQTDHEGEIAGLQALVPYANREPFTRRKPFPPPTPEGYGYAGAFGQLLEQEIDGETIHARLKRFIVDCEQKRRHKSPRPELPAIHAYFKKLCRDIGLTQACYPFCTDSVAYRSVATLVRKVRTEYYAAQDFRLDNWRDALGEDGRLLPFEKTELDEHLCDQWPFAKNNKLEVVWSDGPHVRFLPLERLMVIVEIDMGTQVSRGYRLCERGRNNAEDVVDCLAAGLVPHTRCEPSLPGLRYPDAPAFPSEIADGLAYRGRATLKLDNDRTHYAKRTQRAAIELQATEVNYGNKGSPKSRGYIEGLFDRLEDLLRMLPCFTGKFPGDERGKRLGDIHPDEYLFIDQLCECIEIALAEINTTPNSGLGGMTPIEYLGHNHARDNLLAYFSIPEENIEQCYIDTRIVTVRRRKGLPCVQTHNGRYYDPVLVQWVDKQLKVSIDRRDGRVGTLYTLLGEPIGTCTYRGALQHRRHHVDERRKFAKWARTDRLKRRPDEAGFANYVAEQADLAKTSRREAARLEQIRDRIDIEDLPHANGEQPVPMGHAELPAEQQKVVER